MRRRRIRNGDPSSFLGLDSFMDIVTNVIGALFFVVVYAALASAGAKSKVTALMATPSETEPVFFECRSKTVLFPDFDGLKDDGEKRGRSRNSFCKYRSYNNGLVDVFTPIRDAKGENIAELRRENSNYLKELAKLDPEKQHVHFIVRTDSFEVFRIARRVAIQQGFKTGWEPLDPKTDVVFSPGGRSLVIHN